MMRVVNRKEGPPFLDKLLNRPYFRSSQKYTVENNAKAFKHLKKLLLSFLKVVDATDFHRSEHLSYLVSEAMDVREESVLLSLLEETLQNSTLYRKVIRFIERLAQYDAALDTLRRIAKKRTNSHNPIFNCHIDVVFTSPKSAPILLPSLQELKEWVLRPDSVPRTHIPDNCVLKYEQQITNFQAKEHCEIQLIRFYLENPDFFPVLPYFGVSGFCCFM